MPVESVLGGGSAVNGLGGVLDYGEITIQREDDGCHAVDISSVFENGIVINGTTYSANAFFVNTNGSVSFGAGLHTMPDSIADISVPFIAPFMADIDTRIDGEGAESGQIYVDVDPVNDIVTITWAAVGFYRRQAQLTNTFQLQLLDRGDGTFDIVMRYENVDWTAGDLEGGIGGNGGQAATIGYRLASTGGMTLLPASGNEALQLDLENTLGNNDRTGLWVFESTSSAGPTTFEGNHTNDQLTGTWRGDILRGHDGDDTLDGGGGNDTFVGGAGQDYVSYARAKRGIVVDLLDTDKNTDEAKGDRYETIEGLIGSHHNDTLGGDGGSNNLLGGNGSDSLSGRDGNDTLGGGAGDDRIFGGNDADTLFGGDGNDLLAGEAGYDRLEGGAGNDTMSGGAGNDVILGGLGNDLMYGGHNADILTGDDGDDHLLGQLGNDRLEGGLGADILEGGAGNDRMFGGDGADILKGGFDNDLIAGENGNDRLEGGIGNDTLGGGAGDDRIFGGNDADTLCGGDGNDLVAGETGYDRLEGGAGNDTMGGGAGNDVILGGLGNDLMYGGHNADILIGGDGDDRLLGQLGNDRLEGGLGADILEGGAGHDRIFGGDGADILKGGFDNDLIAGENGNDRLEGGIGNDTLGGGAGDDIMLAGEGNDRIFGGYNADTFIFFGNFGQDLIMDFDAQSPYEKIDLSGVAVIEDYADLMANHIFTQGSDVVIDDRAGNTIRLIGVSLSDLDASDFIL